MYNAPAFIDASTKVTMRDRSVYIALAARRSLSDFLAYKKLTLDVVHAPDNKELYIKNPLLYVENGNIHFLPEEQPIRKT